ncbi:MAG: HD domain-containing protein [Lachnospiraceae bacterium]|nr:HD domain-containing protein [Lachnospiraceae bacterium]
MEDKVVKKLISAADNNRIRMLLLVFTGVLANVLPAYMANSLGLPLFLDTIGTIAASALGGIFPGILVGMLTNVICMIFDPNAIYLGSINALTAVFAGLFVYKYSFRRVRKTVIFVVCLGFFVGVTTAVIHWFLLGGSRRAVIAGISDYFKGVTGMHAFWAFLITNILLNVLDKGITTLVVCLFMIILPQKFIESFGNSGWKQRPLTDAELKSIRKWGKKLKFSLRVRMTLTIIAITIVLVIVTGWIGTRLYYDNEKLEKTENALNAVKFAADIIDAEKVNDYLKYGRDAKGYEETERLLTGIKKSITDAKYLYVLKIEEDGCYVVFDVETEDTPAYQPGEKIEFEEAFYPYIDALLRGEEIEPIDSDYISGWVRTVYYPVKKENGRTVCYACADVSLMYMADYMKLFIIKAALILAGFFLLIISFGIWITEIYIVFPISSIAECVDGFSYETETREQIEEDVKRIRGLEIRTGDEVEKLYDSICQMILSQAEQMRSIKRLSDSTAKMQDGLIITMADMVENRDSDTGAHIQKTAAYVRIIVEGLRKKGYYAGKITPKFISDVVRSAPLHDVGKINISDKILNKPGKLTDEEFEIMKSHTTAGRKIIERAIGMVEGENYLKEARNMAAYHHERWDGKGYPEGLHGEVIPLSARIMAVADVFDALTSPRVYKPAFSLEKALTIIEEGKGTQFDEKCVEVLMESLDEVKFILRKYNDEN